MPDPKGEPYYPAPDNGSGSLVSNGRLDSTIVKDFFLNFGCVSMSEGVIGYIPLYDENTKTIPSALADEI